MVEVRYIDWELLDREQRFDLIMGEFKVTKRVYETKTFKVANFNKQELPKNVETDTQILNYLWELFNLHSYAYGVRSMSVGDIISIGRKKYIVAPFGFDVLAIQ